MTFLADGKECWDERSACNGTSSCWNKGSSMAACLELASTDMIQEASGHPKTHRERIEQAGTMYHSGGQPKLAIGNS
ncbi:uncharacterized protein ANIA_11362 [Aspergillus nidulans FGSC A4]|uniref:Uncharacterized protein n=1 Tax=Emericella nidulans (strain FGSC A4 / ATCC 38163 / CBS 112.46 / NRRL 194 / M139) TaxID=227321 RepID=C8VJW4_EMENI|nr:hypothetical protein [Aspergillus nidulans FGSC A4]CBF84072.1 TPA: hypothetical protein ANIA_11362 [Aspergillus nidulans FGSC A4]